MPSSTKMWIENTEIVEQYNKTLNKFVDENLKIFKHLFNVGKQIIIKYKFEDKIRKVGFSGGLKFIRF